MTHYEEFEKKFSPRLKDSPRWTALQQIVKELLEKENPTIVETGTIRLADNWLGDGQSTQIWDWIVRVKNGTALSVDIDPDACKLAAKLCPDVQVYIDDSITFLRGELPPKIDLLYLDAFNYDQGSGRELSSMMHHAAELASAWDKLPSGCLIAVDDCASPNIGKHALVSVILKAVRVLPEIESYLTVWRKP